MLSLASTPPHLAAGQDQTGDPILRQELTRLLESGQTQGAIQRVQAALGQAPEDVGVRHEFVTLHLALARDWLAQRRFDDCLAAVGAILAVQPDHAPALTIRRRVLAAREKAANQTPEVDRLLRLELFESARERIQEVKALRPDLGETLAGRERAAWLGAADDHYLAGNSNEAFALYEHLLSTTAGPVPDVRSRWSISLALALLEGDRGSPIDPGVAGRMQARATDILSGTGPPLIGQAIGGLLAERSGRPLDAGRLYAQALGVVWELPPADQRRAAMASLREQVGEHLRKLYNADRTRRRDGAWQIILPDVWKHRRTAHFDVYARNDLVAERVAEAAEFHFAGLSGWLNVPPAGTWEPRCELRIHATLEDLHQAAGSQGVTHSLTRTRVQRGRVLLRRMDLLQNDPWLLGSTLPHELTHLLLADAYRDGKVPLALDTGLALQAEPPARRLQSRRALGPSAPDPDELLSATGLPADQLAFYAHCDTLTGLLLRQAGIASPDRAGRPAIATVLQTFQDGYSPHWWQMLGWESAPALRREWAAWHAARCHPPRMPLMILAQPSAREQQDGE